MFTSNSKIDLINSPVIFTPFTASNEGEVVAPGAPQFIVTQDADFKYIVTQDGKFIVTQG